MKPSSVAPCTRRALFGQLVNPLRRVFSPSQPPITLDIVSVSPQQTKGGISRRLFLGFMALVGLESLSLKLMGCGPTESTVISRPLNLLNEINQAILQRLTELRYKFTIAGNFHAESLSLRLGLMGRDKLIPIGAPLYDQNGCRMLRELDSSKIEGNSPEELRSRDLSSGKIIGATYLGMVSFGLMRDRVFGRPVYEFTEVTGKTIRIIKYEMIVQEGSEPASVTKFFLVDEEGKLVNKNGDKFEEGAKKEEVEQNGQTVDVVPVDLKQSRTYYSVDANGKNIDPLVETLSGKIPVPISSSQYPAERIYEPMVDPSIDVKRMVAENGVYLEVKELTVKSKRPTKVKEQSFPPFAIGEIFQSSYLSIDKGLYFGGEFDWEVQINFGIRGEGGSRPSTELVFGGASLRIDMKQK